MISMSGFRLAQSDSSGSAEGRGVCIGVWGGLVMRRRALRSVSGSARGAPCRVRGIIPACHSHLSSHMTDSSPSKENISEMHCVEEV